MRIKGFKRNPRATKKAVDQFGFVDVVKILTTNSLPAMETDGSNTYNGIDDPSSILGKPHDVFEAMAMQQAIKDYKPDSSSSGAPVKESEG